MTETAGTTKLGRLARLRERREDRRRRRAWRRERRKGFAGDHDPMSQPQNSKHEGNFSKQH
jgi:hypothetical protein